MTDQRFTEQQQEMLMTLLAHRRDVRGNRFTGDDIDQDALSAILHAATQAPSVGFSQPWEFVIIREPEIKESIAAIFEHENTKAKDMFKDQKAEQYARLKLEGITAAPLNIAVFYKPSNEPVLGQTSVQEVGEYSVVCAVQNMWLMSRALNIGMGWVSILDSEKVKQVLNAPQENKLVAYLCLGQVDHFYDSPELEQLKWADRKLLDDCVVYNKYAQKHT